MKTITPTILTIFLLISCDTTLTGYPYTIHAVYQAPLTNLQITIDSNGRVPPGADISDDHNGTVILAPISPPGKKITLTFIDHSQVKYVIGTNIPQTAPWGFRDRKRSLSAILEEAGYSSQHTAEIAEIIKVVGGALAGPKAVTLNGQSHHLKVVNVDVSR